MSIAVLGLCWFGQLHYNRLQKALHVSGQKTIFKSIVSSFLDKNSCQICTRGEATIQIITKLCSLFRAPQNEWKLLANIINWVTDCSLFGWVSEFSSNPHVFLVKSVNFLKQMLSNPGFVADLEGCRAQACGWNSWDYGSNCISMHAYFFIYDWTNRLYWWWLDCTWLHSKFISRCLKIFGANFNASPRRLRWRIMLPKPFGIVVMLIDSLNFWISSWLSSNDLSMKQGSLFCFVTMRSTKPGCFRSCLWYLWKVLDEEGGALSWFNDIWTCAVKVREYWIFFRFKLN